MAQNLLGVDIGGTKCAVIYGIDRDGDLSIVDKVRFDTTDKDSTVTGIIGALRDMCADTLVNTISLLIVGLVGGVILPTILGWVSDVTGSQVASVITIAVAWIYILWLARSVRKI